MPERRHTFLLYLNDLYPGGAGGGQTSFPALNVSVEPRRGRTLVDKPSRDRRRT
jgi:hypothetical protein